MRGRARRFVGLAAGSAALVLVAAGSSSAAAAADLPAADLPAPSSAAADLADSAAADSAAADLAGSAAGAAADAAAATNASLDAVAAGPLLLVPPDDYGDEGFGGAVDIDGDTMVIGATCGSTKGSLCLGAAYIFVRADVGWVPQAKLTPRDLGAADQFGSAVAVSGDLLVVGAVNKAIDGDRPGAAYIYARTDGRWRLQARLTAPTLEDGDDFGAGVAVDGTAVGGTAVVVSAPSRDIGSTSDNGQVFVFAAAGSTWALQATLSSPSPGSSDHFGAAFAVQGDTVIAASRFEDAPGEANAGAAYVFVRSGSTWPVAAQLRDTDTEVLNFGTSVALDGTTAVVGNGVEDGDGRFSSAYVFEGSGAAWTQQERITGSRRTEFDGFAESLDLSGDNLVIGAPTSTVKYDSEGAAYGFTRDAGPWTQRVKLTAVKPGVADEFGRAVAIDGTTLVIGDPKEDEVYVYER